MTEDVKFMVWLNREIMRRDGKPTAEERVRKDLAPGNLRVETRETGRWEVADDRLAARMVRLFPRRSCSSVG